MIKPAIAFFFGFLLIYLLGVFVLVDFDISNWDIGWRFLVATVGLVFSMCFAIAMTGK